MEKQKQNAVKWLCIALILCIVGAFGAHVVQTDSGKVTLKKLNWETSAGRMMSALLLVPETATKENPAPAIVTSHGWYNNKEMQDLNFVELSRRGFVVLSIDMYGHGDSDYFYDVNEGWKEHGTGMVDGVLLLADLPYVDSSKIGITGHSNGARAAKLTIDWDNQNAEPMVASVLLIANDPDYKDADGNYYNKYGSRDVGVIAAQYDEFFFRGGGTNVPRDYINNKDAQSFLNFGRTDGERRESYTMYKENVNGEEAIRVIYNPDQIHPWNHTSKEVVVSTLEYFDASLGAPNMIAPESQKWQVKVFFNTLGLIGFALFLIYFTIFMVFTPAFASLRAKEVRVAGPAPEGKNKIWFWVTIVISVVFSGCSYMPILNWAAGIRPAMFWQAPPFQIAMWAVACGILAIILMVITYQVFGKKEGFSLTDTGICIGKSALAKTVLLAVVVAFTAFLILFLADFFFKADFRIWVLAIKTFTANKFDIFWRYILFFLIFYVANSVANNCFNFNGKKEWLNTLLLAFAIMAGPLVVVIIQYNTFFSTGEMFWNRLVNPQGPIGGIWIFPLLVILPFTVLVTRKIYRVTNNPYLPAIINALVITIVTCTNTLTIPV